MRPSVRAEKYGCPQCVPESTSVTLAVDEKTLPMATITGRTDRRTDRQTDRQSATMRPPPREEGRIKSSGTSFRRVAAQSKHSMNGKLYERKPNRKLLIVQSKRNVSDQNMKAVI